MDATDVLGQITMIDLSATVVCASPRIPAAIELHRKKARCDRGGWQF
jgi:hypothetical protein